MKTTDQTMALMSRQASTAHKTKTSWTAVGWAAAGFASLVAAPVETASAAQLGLGNNYGGLVVEREATSYLGGASQTVLTVGGLAVVGSKQNKLILEANDFTKMQTGFFVNTEEQEFAVGNANRLTSRAAIDGGLRWSDFSGTHWKPKVKWSQRLSYAVDGVVPQMRITQSEFPRGNVSQYDIGSELYVGGWRLGAWSQELSMNPQNYYSQRLHGMKYEVAFSGDRVTLQWGYNSAPDVDMTTISSVAQVAYGLTLKVKMVEGEWALVWGDTVKSNSDTQKLGFSWKKNF